MSVNHETRSRAELYAEAARLRGFGFTPPQIARLMGKSVSSVRNWFSDPDGSKQRERRKAYEGECVDCGGATKSDGTSRASKRCGPCAHEHAKAERMWTGEAIIDAIRLFARENGRPPLAAEWICGPRDPRFPRASNIYRSISNRTNPFASWAEAIEAAGFPRPRVGRKVMPHGQGRHTVARTYVVLTRNGDGHFKEHSRVEAFSPEIAIEKAAESQGEYVAVLTTAWVERQVAPVTKLAIVKEPQAA